MDTKTGIRLRDMDIAKGIGIMLVVYAHASAPFSSYIVQFHMPFFFFLSGMLYEHRGRSIAEYAKNKAVALLLPFWCWNLLLYPVFYIFYYGKTWATEVIVKDAAEIILTVDKVPFLGATWFLPALFFISLLVHIYVSVCKGNKWFESILLPIGAAIAVTGFCVPLPYRLNRVLICSLFYICGYLYKKYIEPLVGKAAQWVIMIAGTTFFVIAGSHNYVDMGQNMYANRWLFVAGALAISVVIRYLAAVIAGSVYGSAKEAQGSGRKKSKELTDNQTKSGSAASVKKAPSPIRLITDHFTYLGKNTYAVMIWHFLAFRVAILIQIVFSCASIKDLTAFPVYDTSGGWWIVYLIAGLYGALLWETVLEHIPFSGIMRRLGMIR